VQTLRFYEREGLLPAPPRTPSGYRHYPEEAVERLVFIRRAKELGFTLREIRSLLALGAEGASAAAREQALRTIAQIDARIGELEGVKRTLQRLVGACSGRGPVSQCPILQALWPEGESSTSGGDAGPSPGRGLGPAS
jgi:DNA-binding transcriptional MerR regulator